MAKRGRPRLAESEKRSRLRYFALNEEEDRKLAFLCKQYGVNVSTVARYAIASIYDLETQDVTMARPEQFQ